MRAFDNKHFDDERFDDEDPSRKITVRTMTLPVNGNRTTESTPSNQEKDIIDLTDSDDIALTSTTTTWVKLDDILKNGFKYNAVKQPTLKETVTQFIDDVRLYLKRNAIEQPLDAFYTKSGSISFISEKGFCLLMLMMKDFDGNNVYVQHWVSFRFYYRKQLFGTKTKGINIKKPQSIEDIEICTICNLEDIQSQFVFDNPCDCQSILHKSCTKMEVPYTEEFEFCPLCIAYLPLEDLRERRKLYSAEETAADFEVESVVDYDPTDNQYIVKWKGYPIQAICKTEVAQSFIDLVTAFWSKPENQPVPQLAKQGMESINEENESNDTESSSDVDEDDDQKMTEQKPPKSLSDSVTMTLSGDEMDSKMNSLSLADDAEKEPKVECKMESNKVLGEGIFVPIKLQEVMDPNYIIRRQKYTKDTFERMKTTQNKYRKWLQREIKNETAIGMELKAFMVHHQLERLPKYHLRSVNKDWDCDLPRIRDLIIKFLSRDWSQWTHDISHPSVVVAEIIDPTNPAKKYGADQGVHDHKAYGLFAVNTIPRDAILFEYAGCVTPIGIASEKLSHLETELDQTTLFDLIGHLDADRSKLFWGKRANDQLVIDPSRWHNEGVYMNDFRDNVLDDPDDDEQSDSEMKATKNVENESNTKSGRKQNVKFYEVLVNGWPRVFAVAIEEIGAGEEMLGNYGCEFWKNFRLMMRRQHQLSDIKQRINKEWTEKYEALQMRFNEQSEELERLRKMVGKDGNE